MESLAGSLAEGRWRAESDGLEPWVRRLETRPPIMVVVPIYDGVEPLGRLLACAALWREAESVLLVDDCSADPRIAPLLAEAAQAHPNATRLRNRRNLGFVRTVNAGLERRKPGSDVLVLNSDTVLGRGWSTALSASAYAYPNVATVSPLSNGGGFFSVPRSNCLNEIPSGWDVEDCAALLSWIAPVMHEETPASCGFCWYVRSDALDRVGRLDDMMFFRGYAEETDFCLRATDAGMRNLCHLAHFVAHAGGESFTTEKTSLKKTNAKILGAMQPTFLERLIAYEAQSVIPRLGGPFAVETGVPPGPSRPASAAQGLTIRVARQLEDEPSESTLGIEVGESHLRLVLGRHSSSLRIASARMPELVTYLLLRLRPDWLAADTELLDPLVMRAAAAVGTRLGRPNRASQTGRFTLGGH